MLRFSIVLPCYNEEKNLPTLLNRYVEVWEDLPAELILVDNGSTDHTAQVLARELSQPELHFARVVTVAENRGYGYGLMRGLAEARGEIIGYSHADLQCDTADLFRAYHAIAALPDPASALIKGRRARRALGAELVTGGMSLFASTILTTWLSDINAQPKVFHCSHLARLQRPPDGFQFDLYVLYAAKQTGLRIRTISVTFRSRVYGKSKWASSFRSSCRTVWDTIAYMFRLRWHTS